MEKVNKKKKKQVYKNELLYLVVLGKNLITYEVLKFDEKGKLILLEENPKNSKSNCAI